jgi:hypothetical protein
VEDRARLTLGKTGPVEKSELTTVKEKTMAPTIPFVIDPNASTDIIAVAKSMFAFDGSKTLCKCNMFIMLKTMNNVCSNCNTSFEDALEYQQKYIAERVQHEIDSIATAKAAEAAREASLPAGISKAIKNMFDEHLVPAYEEESAHWKMRITDKGFGDHPYETANILDIYYRDLPNVDKKKVLDMVRNETEHTAKVDAYQKMLQAAKTYAAP